MFSTPAASINHEIRGKTAMIDRFRPVSAKISFPFFSASFLYYEKEDLKELHDAGASMAPSRRGSLGLSRRGFLGPIPHTYG